MTQEVPQPKPKRFTARFEGDVIGTAELRQVPVEAIKIDHDYQRGQNSKWIADHMPFDPQKASTLVLSGRTGGPYCIDGGHRLALARASGVHHINAFVIDGLSKQLEARLFSYYQRERRNLSAHDLFRADVTAGDQDTLDMVRILTAAGFEFSQNGTGPRTITAIDSCRWIQKYGGNELLARTLNTVKQYWFGYDKALSGQVLKGVALFLSHVQSQSQFDRRHFEQRMLDYPPLKILGFAQQLAVKRMSASTSQADVADAIRDRYNFRLKKENQLGPLTIGGKRRPTRPLRVDGTDGPVPVGGQRKRRGSR